MDRYFQCLIRRVSGEFHKHTIQPSIRVLGNFYDPFESTAVRPLQYPDSKTKKTDSLADQKNTIKDKDPSERKLQKISEHKLPAIKLPEKSSQTSLKRVDKQSISLAISYENIKQPKTKPTITRDPTIAKSKVPGRPLEKKEFAEQKGEPTHTRNSKKLDRITYLKTIAVKLNRPPTAVDQPFHRTEEKTGKVERSMVKHVNPYVKPKRVEPIPRRSFTQITPSLSKRRSATRAAKENRLSVGNLVVDVVPVSETFRRRSSSRVRKTKVQKQSKSSLGRQTANLCFGLGQM